ncbi:DUF898 family protein [Azospira restricta]|uniref:DUF898 family protein n=1 Tax=Azospira restricta TaxID=404405 RepID=A0A974SNR3_9RHOO|nr:DUF898 family protein [Azospira restricta]QRJ63661.1 DUF898 family protein [Azospira restricta]
MDNLYPHRGHSPLQSEPPFTKGEPPAVDTTCPYALLGIASDASTAEITAAYARALGRIRERLAAGNPLPPEHLDAVRTAHRTLTEPGARNAYDRALAGRLAAKAPPAAAANAAGHAAGGEAAVEFSGQGHEYLRIWLVSVALTVLTLGIYSAWAKVRREKYFHRNFIVDGASFDYHGNPRAILLGRMVLVVLVGLASFAEHLGKTANILASLASMFVFPWLLVRSLQFRARNTSYRGMRFCFSGTYRQALALYLLHGGLTVLTLGLYFPAFLRRQKAFAVDHLAFGDARCRFAAGTAAFYRGLALPMTLWIVVGLGTVALFAATAAGIGKGGVGLMTMLFGPLLVAGLALVVNLVVVPYARVVGTNLLWNGAQLGDVRFRCTQRVRTYLGLTLGNWLLTLLTLGFFWPLAQIRMARYRARNLVVLNPAALDGITGRAQASPNALGDAATDAFDLDIAL